MTSRTRREFLRDGAFVLTSGALATGLLGCRMLTSEPESVNDGDTLRFIHVTDTHLDLAKPKTVKWVEMMVNKVNKDFSSVDFVLFGGDNFNNNVAGKSDAVKFKKIADGLRPPWYSVRGNKESCPTPKGDPLGQSDYARMFFPSGLEIVGRDWKFNKGSYTILGIDTTLEQKNNGIYTPASLAFAEDQLKKHLDRYHVLLNHQTYGNFWGGTEKADIHNYVLNNADEVKKRLFSYRNLTLTLSGHKHLDNISRAKGVTVIATLGFVVPQDPNDEDDHRFRYIEIRKGAVEQRLVSIV